MLTMPPDSSSVVSIVGLDPGSETLGAAVLYVDMLSWQIIGSEAYTFKGSKLAGKDDWTTEVHGNRLGRIAAHEENLLAFFRYYRPLAIASESPFFNRLHPSAFGPLMEVISAIRSAAMQYDLWKQVYLIDPPSVKNAVGVHGGRGGEEGKRLMKQAVLVLAPVFRYSGPTPLDQLDEHSIDALAVAYCRYQQIKAELCL